MSSKVKLTFLGTSDAVPSSRRNHTSILLSNDKENILIDCGEGTQRQFRKARLSPMKVSRLLVTHWHGDHILGIPGLLQTLAFEDYKKTLFIYGPKGTKKFMHAILNAFTFHGKINLKIEEVREGKFFENDDFYLESKQMTHGVPCNAYSFVKKGKIKIDKKKLKKSGLSEGPILKNFKEGEDIVHQGKKYLAKSLTYMEGDKKVSFVLDTSFNNKIAPFVKNSDLLICESNFSSDDSDLAKERKHMTSKNCGEIANKSGSKKLLLTHISRRYDGDLNQILGEAKKYFKKTSIVNDLDVIQI